MIEASSRHRPYLTAALLGQVLIGLVLALDPATPWSHTVELAGAHPLLMVVPGASLTAGAVLALAGQRCGMPSRSWQVQRAGMGASVAGWVCYAGAVVQADPTALTDWLIPLVSAAACTARMVHLGRQWGHVRRVRTGWPRWR